MKYYTNYTYSTTAAATSIRVGYHRHHRYSWPTVPRHRLLPHKLSSEQFRTWNNFTGDAKIDFFF